MHLDEHSSYHEAAPAAPVTNTPAEASTDTALIARQRAEYAEAEATDRAQNQREAAVAEANAFLNGLVDDATVRNARLRRFSDGVGDLDTTRGG